MNTTDAMAGGHRGRTLLRGGTVIDGTGGSGLEADVEVVDGRIGQIAPDLPTDDAEIVDVSGLVVAPGFIDVHTHYDAQILWDPALTPSPWHGVTTVVMGNCGFGIAPTRPEHRQLILGILEMVEDMSPTALSEGVTWGFASFPEYLDVIDGLDKQINVAVFVGHTPTRIAVMGEDALERAATPDELEQMRRIVAEARAAGAWGLASSLADNHVGPGGRPVPSYIGSIEELVALSGALESGVVQVARGKTAVQDIGRLARPGITTSWSSLLTGRPGEARGALDLLADTAALEGEVWPQIACRPITVQTRLSQPIALGILHCMKEILGLDPAEREARYRDPDWRRRALEEAGESWRPMWERASALVGGVEDPAEGIAVQTFAEEKGLHPMEALIDLALEHGLDTRFSIPVANLDEDELGRMLEDPRALLGLSDAGAHLNQQCDASFSTHLLEHWVRDTGVLTLEQAVWRLTGHPASVYGFSGRGRIAPGFVADLTAFDPDRVGAEPLERVADFPGSSQRLLSDSRGVEHVWVAGVSIRREGASLDTTPGALLRGG